MGALLLSGCGEEGEGRFPAEPTGDPCEVDGDCPLGARCVRLVCELLPTCAEGGRCPCQDDAQCPTNSVCDAPTGLCIELGCTRPQDCAPNQDCVESVCVDRRTMGDQDNDGVGDDIDNCPTVFNPAQDDRDNDGVGDACEEGNTFTDTDNDGVGDDIDNCPTVSNADQLDLDGDDEGDACDDDDDGDLANDDDDNCPRDFNISQDDLDDDGLGNPCDPDWPGTTLQISLDAPEGAPVDDARLLLSRPGQETPETLTPDDEGVFSAAGLLEPGSLTLSLMWPGWRLTEGPRTINFAPDPNTLTLDPLPVEREALSGLTIAVSLTPQWIPDPQRFAQVRVESSTQVTLLTATLTEGSPERFEDITPDTVTLYAERAGFQGDALTLTLGAEGALAELSLTLDNLATAALDLDGVNLGTEDFANMADTDVNVRGADFSGAIIDADLSDIALNFSSARFVNADLGGAVMANRTLTLADFTDASAIAADFTNAAMTGVTLDGASLVGASLNAASLNAASLVGADLRGADLSDASLLGATLDGADLAGAIFNDATICPDGQTHADTPRCGL